MSGNSAEQQSSPGPEPSVLDRRLDLTGISAHALAWGAVMLLAVAIRLPARGDWPLSPGESSIALDAWALLHGNDLGSNADSHPVTVQITALLFFLFGDSDQVARLLPLLTGIAMVVALYWSRHWFGNLPAICIAAVWAISPVMAQSTLRLDGGALLVLSSFLVLTIVFALFGTPATGKAVVLGIVLAIGLTSDPLGWVFLPVTLLVALFLVREVRLHGHLLAVTAAFLASLLVITTWIGTRPAGLPAFFSESLGALEEAHFAGFGGEWALPLLVAVIDEPLTLFLAITGIALLLARARWVRSVHPAIFFGMLTWAIPMLTLALLLSGTGTALYAIGLLPLIVLGGLGLSMLVEAVRNNGIEHIPALLWILATAALIVAIVRFADDLVRGPGIDALSWLIGTTVLGLLILLPLAYVVIRLSAGQGWRLVPVGLLAIAILFAGLGLRTTVLLPFTTGDRPGELLNAGGSLPAVGHFTERIRTYSRDSTTYLQDVRDPAGGRGLIIAVESGIADPWAWYFRDFPNFTIIQGPEDLPAEVPADLIILPPEELNAYDEYLREHEGRSYPGRFAAPGEIDSATRLRLLASAVNPLDYRDMLNFIIYRRSPGLLETREVTVHLRQDHAERVWGSGTRDDLDSSSLPSMSRNSADGSTFRTPGAP